MCFHINNNVCVDTVRIQQHCSNILETLIIECSPHYCVQDISSIILAGVYIPRMPLLVTHLLGEQICWVENKKTSYKEMVTCATYDGNILN